MKRLTHFLAALAALILFGAAQAPAQDNPFAPRITVNDVPITGYEIAQRAQFLALLRTPGDPEEQAIDQLIDDKLRLIAARQLGLSVTDEEVNEGMSEFAGRANLDTEQFLAALAQGGVDPQAFRSFVEAGLAWRKVVREKFGNRARIPDAEVDRALALTAQTGRGTRVLLSEIILPATPEYAAQSQALAGQLAATLRSEAAFASAARQYSVSPTRDRGGRIDWIPIANLPPQIRGQILGLAPGQVSAPIPLGNAIALFQLRAIGDGEGEEPSAVSVEYAEYLIPGGQSAAAQSEAARVRARVDTCDDLYAVAKGQPPERLTVATHPLGEVPGDVALELARLDEGESSTALTRGGSMVFLMLCARTPLYGEETAPDRDSVRSNLVNRRLGGLADVYLAELRADAHIVGP